MGCQCGCGEPVAKGRQFRQGHDAKLKSKLIKAHLAGDAEAMAVATNRGWAHFIERAERRGLIGRKVPVRVGRWDYEGAVVEVENGVATVHATQRSGKPMEVQRPVAEL